eukprot:Nk52_evm41s1129 gene=Nk52_evmTU41s1129
MEETIRGVEVLVYNVSHADLLVAVKPSGEDASSVSEVFPPPGVNNAFIAQPNYQHFQATSDMVLGKLQEEQKCEIREVTDQEGNIENINIGFNLEDNPVQEVPYQSFRFRGSSNSVMYKGTELSICGVYFPIMSCVMPMWNDRVDLKSNTKKLLYLISGSGQRRNAKQKSQDNSTEGTAKLLETYVKHYYPDITVVRFPAGPEIFKYDENVNFVNRFLRPKLDKERAKVAEEFGEEWPNNFNVTISLSEGTAARLTAITAGLRIYRPNYLHVWQPKSLWHEGYASRAIVEYHTFQKIETVAPISVKSVYLDEKVKDIVKEMHAYKEEFEETRAKEGHELEKFWLRKTKKPVLSVLLIEKENGEKKYLRGMNIEVSMPTGTLCAERNAIGNALSSDPSLTRRDLKMVAVLSIPLSKNASGEARVSSKRNSSELPEKLTEAIQLDCPDNNNTSPRSRHSRKRTMSEILEPLSEDLNPMAPCGACTEWLKKIAEVNPDFKVVTFQNISIQKVFVKLVM